MNSKKELDVTIALVNYKTPQLLISCLKSIYRCAKGFSFEVCLVDNASNDESVTLVKKLFPQVEITVNSENVFATRGFNQILRKAQSRYSLILSPDVEFSQNSILKMVKYLDKNKNVAALSCRQIDKQGIVDTTCSRFSSPRIEFYSANIINRIFKNNKLLYWYKYGEWDRSGVRKVDVISDTIMLTRSDVLRKIGFYDEGMDLFFMENDLCLRFKKAGFSVWHLGTTTVLHHKGQSTIKFLPKQMYQFYEKDMLYYYKKHFGFWWWLFLRFTFFSNIIYYLLEPVFNRRK